MNNPKVSVIVPVYNGAKYLDECISSIVNQTLKDIEIIIVDDASTDSSWEIIEEWAWKDERIIPVPHAKNEGTGKSINDGILIAKGEYIGEVDCDDFIDKEMYEYLYGLTKKGIIDVVKSGYYQYMDKDNDMPVNLVGETTKVICPRHLNYSDRLHWFQFQPSFWSAIYRRRLIKDFGLYWNETEGASFQDTSIIFKINCMADTVIWSDKCFYHWRCSDPHSITSAKWPMAVLDEYDSMEAFLDIHPEFQLQCRYVLSRLRFGTYIWNFFRIEEKDRKVFGMKAAEDLVRDWDYQDFRYYDPQAWNCLRMWTTQPEDFIKYVKKGTKEDEQEELHR